MSDFTSDFCLFEKRRPARSTPCPPSLRPLPLFTARTQKGLGGGAVRSVSPKPFRAEAGAGRQKPRQDFSTQYTAMPAR